ncbi:molybdopterin/thiamine biosynthesis adenylyltransferase [Litoreibacter meonggei]|uniref:Molybdopterin-synthase adenylyltransferase n=1 Tax=Litoreibacter meonggei TaxID=1049199 RepID=A0A497X451_9RHOB|nr:molybdopterin-synthase adenylyltransferase MoeB [Litoreibacter meonggei]RLJ59424.1 molybdopterin/thiamine biosynthesis adenylyltransferase [Litoreibacter meonggei]
MVLVLVLAATILLAGRFGLPKRLQIMALVALFALVLFFQLTLPAGNPVKDATGSLQGWAIFAGVAVIFVGYRALLTRLRRRSVEDVPEPANPDKFTEAELNRYARHIVLREIGGPGQKKMKKARVLVVGAGGLGAPALQYLAAAGVGTIGVIDDDVVDSSNLQRQVIHTDARVGMPKVFSAQEAMQAQNPFVMIRPYNRRLTEDMAADLFADYDLILDGCDNADTRYLVNRAAVQLGKPLISGAITQWEGQLSLFHPASDGPCYACVFPSAAAAGLAPSCSEAGVVGALPGVVGSMMAVEAIKHVTGAGAPLRGQMLIYDALYAETRLINLKKDPACTVCGQPAR